MAGVLAPIGDGSNRRPVWEQMGLNNDVPGYMRDPNTGAWIRDPQATLSMLKNTLFGGGGSGGGGTAWGMPSGGSGGGGGDLPPQLNTLDLPDNTAANDAEFARAKDQTGQTARASVQSLRDELGATGMLGSGTETAGVAQVANRGLSALGDVSREQAIQGSAQKADFAKTRYQGGIQQRGQDIQHQEAMARLSLQRELAMQDLLRSALAGLTQSY